MIQLQTISDKTAIGLSLLCTAHCLIIPFLLVLFPSLVSLQLDNEAFHFWMMLAVIPTSVYALTLGCKQHGRLHLLVAGSIGIAFLLLALNLPESRLGEAGEKIFTIIGASFVAYSHFRNYKLCRYKANCMCHEREADKSALIAMRK